MNLCQLNHSVFVHRPNLYYNPLFNYLCNFLNYNFQIQLICITESMDIKDMYVQEYKILSHGVEGYQVDNKYHDLRSQENLPKKQTKRGSYLDDYAKIHGSIPGPGLYEYAKDQWPKKVRAKSAKFPQKKTFIAQIMEQSKKEKLPAPGQYKLQKSMKELDQEKKQMSLRKRHYQDRVTYLDGVQYEASQTPGIGAYNVRNRPKSASSVMKSLKPEEWRKKHEEDKKRKKPKRPDMRTYEPKEVKAYSKKPLKQGEWNRVERFKTEKGGSGLGPGKYLNFNDWSGKSKIASRIPYKSTYYH